MVNGGPEAVTVAQVIVDDANWVHTVDGSRRIGRLERRTVRDPVSLGRGRAAHGHASSPAPGSPSPPTIAVATQSPRGGRALPRDLRAARGLCGRDPGLHRPALAAVPAVGSSARWIDFFLRLTIGLLVFLGVDALDEALATSALVPGAFQGPALVLLRRCSARRCSRRARRNGARARAAERSPLWVAALIAFGIGLHNLGEGLAIGTSYATGEIALGTFLVIGFLLHNTTEGLGIVAPLADERPRLAHAARCSARWPACPR